MVHQNAKEAGFSRVCRYCGTQYNIHSGMFPHALGYCSYWCFHQDEQETAQPERKLKRA